VKLRHEMALLLGYPNYIPLAYKLLFRTDYGPNEVKVLREEVRKHVVPLAARIREQQKKLVGAGELKFWDLRLVDGKPAPRPLGNAENHRAEHRAHVRRAVPETGEFFRMMNARGLFDLGDEGRKGRRRLLHQLPRFWRALRVQQFQRHQGRRGSHDA